MFDFLLTPERKGLRDEVRAFVKPVPRGIPTGVIEGTVARIGGGGR